LTKYFSEAILVIDNLVTKRELGLWRKNEKE